MKRLLLLVARYLGVFALCRRATGGRPRILCYHGASLEDEHHFRPGLFMRPETFAARMQTVSRSGFTVCSLDELYEQVARGSPGRNLLVITIDDGWASTATAMMPVLRAQRFPATLYLSTYFVRHRRPVFKVAVQYLFWKHGDTYHVPQNSVLRQETEASSLTVDEILDISRRLGPDAEDVILRELCDHFGESRDAWLRSGKFLFMDEETAGELAGSGLDIQMHTHRHRFAECDQSAAMRELTDNQDAIARVTPRAAEHFCYPRGEYTPMHRACLENYGIKTATTTENELVALDGDRLAWPRIVDSEQVSELEFEAELSGFMSVLRSLTAFRHSRSSGI